MPEKKYATVLVEKKNNYAVLTFNRPEKLNAFNPELIHDFSEALGELRNDDGVRAIVVTGAGESFSAGGDIKADLDPLRKMSEPEFKRYVSEGMVMYKSMLDIEKPIIAAINGYAVGLGMEVCLCCDIRIAAEDAKLGEFFVRMGLITEVGSFLLPRIIGLGKAKLLSFTGDIIGAREAEQIGLVDKVVPRDKLLSSAEELAKRLAQGPQSIGLIKKAINESLSLPFDASVNCIVNLFYQALQTEDHAEAINAWMEKRKPQFKGK